MFSVSHNEASALQDHGIITDSNTEVMPFRQDSLSDVFSDVEASIYQPYSKEVCLN